MIPSFIPTASTHGQAGSPVKTVEEVMANWLAVIDYSLGLKISGSGSACADPVYQ
jgi:hypothetical protein